MMLRAELLGGPLDGQAIRIEQRYEQIFIPVPTGLPVLLSDLDDPLRSTPGPEVAVYTFTSCGRYRYSGPR